MGKRIPLPNEFETIHKNKNDLEKFCIFNYQTINLLPSDFFENINNLKENILSLDRYTHEINYDGGDMVKDLKGDYVLFSDVLEAVSLLFSREKS